MSNYFLVKNENSDSTSMEELLTSTFELILKEYGQILFLLDTTLSKEIFDEIKAKAKMDEIFYIPLAINKEKDSNIFFFQINDLKMLNIFKNKFILCARQQLDPSNNFYHIHGFGASILNINQVVARFKRSLVVKDINQEILFRWYDPRVLVYLECIFMEDRINSLLSIFKQWNFVNPQGFYQWNQIGSNAFKKQPINKLNETESLYLDLIEPSNIIYQQLKQYENIEHKSINTKFILKRLYKAYSLYKIKLYEDLVAYGLYSYILGEEFIHHRLIFEVLDRYWFNNENDYSFTEVMDFVDVDQWDEIKMDLIGRTNDK